MRELIVDAFAGGGGASTGIEMALGRSPDIAINHDPDAIAMHAANHPATRHMMSDVWSVDPVAVCDGRPVGLLWASPDCKHFSKAKGGKPVAKNIRDLAWVVIRWAEAVRPRVICLENVEEFRTWGPLVEVGPDKFLPCPDRKGQTFDRWVGELRRLGYVVEWRELRACDYGAPTIRKRLFLIARCDKRPIAWPEPTHGDPKSAEVKAGRRLPWRTAAEIIDWSLPCPSIFLTREEARTVGANRPLADATMARIAKGVKRYVLDAALPFIVRTAHGEVGPNSKRWGHSEHTLGAPLPTVTASPDFALVAPSVAPFMVPITHTGSDRVNDIAEPVRTLTTAHRGEHAVVAPYLVPRYGERDGQEPRALSVDAPYPTIVPGNNGGALVAPLIVKNNFGDKPHYPIDEPVRTIVAGGQHHMVVAPHIETIRNADKPFNGADEPTHTVTADGARLALVSAFLAQHNVERGGGAKPGRPVDAPISTIMQSGSQQGVIEASLTSYQYSSGPGEGDVRKPLGAITADGNHAAEVRAFLIKYFGSDQDPRLEEPLHTVTSKHRFGLVTVQGEVYRIVDIGMRMLTPRELFRAQGFPDSYIIDRGADGLPTTKTSQVARCGNSVSPVMAQALVAANFVPDEIVLPPRRRQARPGVWNAGPLFVSAGIVVEAAE